jgi:hypothetical protein
VDYAVGVAPGGGGLKDPVSCNCLPDGVVLDTANSLALQLLFLRASESMGNHDSKVVDADSVD